jgi:hypothetical protein
MPYPTKKIQSMCSQGGMDEAYVHNKDTQAIPNTPKHIYNGLEFVPHM